MEQPYGQQPPTPPQVPPPNYGYNGQQSVYAPPPRGSRFGRMLRLLGLRFGGRVAQVGNALRPHWLTAIIAGILLFVIVIESSILMIPPLVRAMFSQGPQQAVMIPPAPAVENFIKGQQEFDAALIWDSFSDQLKNEMREKGRTQTTIQNEVQQNRATGQRYVKFDYVGGVETQYGNKFYYMAEIESPNRAESGVFSYIFTVGPDDKIIEFEEGLPSNSSN